MIPQNLAVNGTRQRHEAHGDYGAPNQLAPDHAVANQWWLGLGDGDGVGFRVES
jgi:hypothetical protein